MRQDASKGIRMEQASAGGGRSAETGTGDHLARIARQVVQATSPGKKFRGKKLGRIAGKFVTACSRGIPDAEIRLFRIVRTEAVWFASAR